MKLSVLYITGVLCVGVCILTMQNVCAQLPDTASKTVVAGPQYNRSRLHNFLWGSHYRKEWSTPVTIKAFYLDTANGGLTAYDKGGSRQTMSLRLHDTQKREYVLRSIDKSFTNALPEVYRGTFVQSIINDQVSIAHPFAAVVVAPLAEKAGIYHTWPQNVFIPQQPSLGPFSNKYGNKLYLFEQRPDGNWETADNFGDAEKIIGTDKLFKKLAKDNDRAVDQVEYVRARLFDMFVGDWGRHEDQWRWAQFDTSNKTVYKPIPRDRDQAFTKFDGVLLKVIKSAAGLSHQQTFDAHIKNIRTYNYAARNLDRVMTNNITRDQWIAIATELQSVLTDEAIESAVHQMPPEEFPISGNEIITKLKARKDDLLNYAKDYYDFLAKEVDVTGTSADEYFEIADDSTGALHLKRFTIDKNGNKSSLTYNRSFPFRETNEVRVYGLGGKDKYDINLAGNSKTTVRVIDTKTDEYNVAGGKKLRLYDADEDTSAAYRYEAFKYNKAGISPSLYYSKQHIIYVGLAYKNTRYKWGKYPYASTHEMYLHYSPTQNALRTGYEGVVNNFIGKWNLLALANYDWVKVINFFGVGNDTKTTTNDRNFYRIRSESGYVSLGLSHNIGSQGNFVVSPFFQTVKLLSDPERFLVKNFLRGQVASDYFDTRKFAGAAAGLRLQRVDDQVLPTKGYRFTANGAYTRNISEANETYSYGSEFHFFVPLSKHFVLSIKNGAATITGEPEFYQLNSIGGRRLRGYRRERFWANTAYYNNNELQYLFNFKSFLFNGKAGLLAFTDQGRVWQKGEKSETWHYGYGGGIILSPFNKIFVSASYGISPENSGIVHVDLRRTLK